MEKFYQHLRAKNDINGNPRRCFVIYNSKGNITDVIDEGYKGLPKKCKEMVQLPSINVSVSEYKDFLNA